MLLRLRFAITDPTADRTITFPDASFTVPSTGGKILQVVQAAKTDTASTTSAHGSSVDISGMSVAITPSASDSDIFILSYLCLSNSTGYRVSVDLLRDTTNICQGAASSSRTNSTLGVNGDATNISMASLVFVDVPGTTSATTYKLQWATDSGGTAYLNRTSNDADQADRFRTASSIIAMEISGDYHDRYSTINFSP